MQVCLFDPLSFDRYVGQFKADRFMPFPLPGYHSERLIALAERAGANGLLLNLNLGAIPHDLRLEQVRRFGREMLPALRARQVTRVPADEALV